MISDLFPVPIEPRWEKIADLIKVMIIKLVGL